MSPERQTVHLRIEGRVQGVGYRAWLEATAIRHGLDGWARNRRDGSVEALLSGPAADVAAVIDACRRGPMLARVDRIDTNPADAPAKAGFDVLPTA